MPFLLLNTTDQKNARRREKKTAETEKEVLKREFEKMEL